jgi:hypothetical protein
MHSTYHPSVTPSAIIGYCKNGTPIRLIAGGNGEGDGDGGNSKTGQEGGNAGTGQQDNSGGGQGGGQGPANSGTSGDGTGSGGGAGAADDSTSKVIEAIRGDYKAERAKRQALERDLADLKAAQATRDQETKNRNLALAKALRLRSTRRRTRRSSRPT